MMICIAGPDGSGKSTQIGLAEAHLQKKGLSVKVVNIWHILMDKRYKGLVGFAGKSQVDHFLGVLSGESRALFLFHCYLQALSDAQKEGCDVILHDAYWYKYLATEAAYGLEMKIYKPLVENLFPAPDLCIYIDLAPEICASRKESFSRYECGFAEENPKEAFVQFQSLCQSVQKKMAKEYGWQVVDGSMPRGKVEAAISALLNRAIATIQPASGGSFF